MAVSEVAICNSALAKLGADRIVSLNDSSKQAQLCKEQYYKVRDELLRGHLWNFATVRKELTPLPTAPVWGYQNAFQLPTDCIRLVAIEEPDDAWSKEGTQVLYDGDTLNITYISDDIPVSNFDATFSEALATRLAYDISYSIVQSVTLKQELDRQFNIKIREARSFDAQESKGQVVRANLWNTSRRSR